MNRRPLDPQDCGLGVSADQSGHSGGVVSVPTCWLSGRMHAVWSPDGPQVGGTACMPYPANSSRAGADLAKCPSSVYGELPRTKLVGVGHGCQSIYPGILALIDLELGHSGGFVSFVTF